MKKLAIIIFAMILSCTAFSQDHSFKNTVVLETNVIASAHLSFDHQMIKFSDKASLTAGGDFILGVGFGYGSYWINPEVGLQFFGPKHFLETGVQYIIELSTSYDEGIKEDADNSFGIKTAYRYQATKGITFRIALNTYFLLDPPILPTLGIGYSF